MFLEKGELAADGGVGKAHKPWFDGKLAQSQNCSAPIYVSAQQFPHFSPALRCYVNSDGMKLTRVSSKECPVPTARSVPDSLASGADYSQHKPCPTRPLLYKSDRKRGDSYEMYGLRFRKWQTSRRLLCCSDVHVKQSLLVILDKSSCTTEVCNEVSPTHLKTAQKAILLHTFGNQAEVPRLSVYMLLGLGTPQTKKAGAAANAIASSGGAAGRVEKPLRPALPGHGRHLPKARSSGMFLKY